MNIWGPVVILCATNVISAHNPNWDVPHGMAGPSGRDQHDIAELALGYIRHMCLLKLDCGYHGSCALDAKGHFVCRCHSDNRHVWGGRGCDRRGEFLSIPSEYIIGIPVSVSVILLVALIFITAMSYFGFRKRHGHRRNRNLGDTDRVIEDHQHQSFRVNSSRPQGLALRSHTFSSGEPTESTFTHLPHDLPSYSEAVPTSSRLEPPALSRGVQDESACTIVQTTAGSAQDFRDGCHKDDSHRGEPHRDDSNVDSSQRDDEPCSLTTSVVLDNDRPLQASGNLVQNSAFYRSDAQCPSTTREDLDNDRPLQASGDVIQMSASCRSDHQEVMSMPSSATSNSSSELTSDCVYRDTYKRWRDVRNNSSRFKEDQSKAFALPRVRSRKEDSETRSMSSRACEGLLRQLSDTYHNRDRISVGGQAERDDSIRCPSRPVDTVYPERTYRVLLMGSLGTEPVFLYEPWRSTGSQEDHVNSPGHALATPHYGHCTDTDLFHRQEPAQSVDCLQATQTYDGKHGVQVYSDSSNSDSDSDVTVIHFSLRDSSKSTSSNNTLRASSTDSHSWDIHDHSDSEVSVFFDEKTHAFVKSSEDTDLRYSVQHPHNVAPNDAVRKPYSLKTNIVHRSTASKKRKRQTQKTRDGKHADFNSRPYYEETEKSKSGFRSNDRHFAQKQRHAQTDQMQSRNQTKQTQYTGDSKAPKTKCFTSLLSQTHQHRRRKLPGGKHSTSKQSTLMKTNLRRQESNVSDHTHFEIHYPQTCSITTTDMVATAVVHGWREESSDSISTAKTQSSRCFMSLNTDQVDPMVTLSEVSNSPDFRHAMDNTCLKDIPLPKETLSLKASLLSKETNISPANLKSNYDVNGYKPGTVSCCVGDTTPDTSDPFIINCTVADAAKPEGNELLQVNASVLPREGEIMTEITEPGVGKKEWSGNDAESHRHISLAAVRNGEEEETARCSDHMKVFINERL